MDVNGGRVSYVGEWGWGWSRTAKSSIYGYYLRMNTTGVYPSDGNARYNGFPLRCLT